jgi:uncharacterized protein (DUF362 family)
MRGAKLLLLTAMVLCACHPPTRTTGATDAAAPPVLSGTVGPVASASAAPDIVAHASVLSDASSSVSVGTSIDGAALRKRHRDAIHADTSPVTVLQATPGPAAAFELGRRLCEDVVPKRPPETPVLLKPNLGGFEWFRDPAKNGGDDGLRGRITDPEFVRGVVRCLRARGHEKITIAEGWGATHKDWVRLVHTSGYEAMANEEHVSLVAMDDDGVFDVEANQPGKPLGLRGMEGSHVPTLLIPKVLAEHLLHGLYLSLPKIKAHRFAVFSMSIKGMQGTVMLSDASPVFRQKWRMHRELNPYLDAQKKGLPEDRAAYVNAIETFAERMSDVLEIEAPDAVLAEGAPAMGGDGFGKMWPEPTPIAIGGTNPVLVDRVGAEWLGFWNNKELGQALRGHTTSPLLETAAKRFDVDITAPSLRGDGRGLFEHPRPVHLVGMAPFSIHSDDTPPLNPGSLALTRPTDGGMSAEAVPNEAPRPTVHAAPLGADTLRLFGRGDDPAWQRATPTTWDTDFAGKTTGIVTRARFLYAPNALYALFEVSGAGLHTDRARPLDVPRSKLYEEDCVELFLTPNPAERHHYYEVELGPFGHYFEVEIDLDTKLSNTAWSSRATLATTQDPEKHTAIVEAKLAAKEIVAALVPGAKLPLGLFRMEGKSPRNYLAWSPALTPKPNFHVPNAFGTLVLDP